MTDNDSLRQTAKIARQSMSPHARATASSRIVRRFFQSAFFFRNTAIACYLSTGEEVDTWSLFDRAWRAGKQIFVPVIRPHSSLVFVELTRNSTLTTNRFGIMEPTGGKPGAASDLDVCIVPTVAFDDAGHRIGMGGGYYDRCFEHLVHRTHWSQPKLVGFAFECQRFEHIDPSPWDVPLDYVFTEREEN